MNKDNKISVIMPIYNGQNYLENSIKKILKQTYKNIELILVNDGSTDDSLNICTSYAMSDSRIKVVNKSNGGICTARNKGLEHATGEYVSFIDQDDKINDNYFTDLISGFSNSTIDMVIAGKVMQLIDSKDNKIIKEEIYKYNNEILDTDEKIIEQLLNKNRDMSMLHLWNCLYKRNILKKYNIKFDETFKYGQEDTMFNIEYASKCKSINKIDKIVYYYARRVSVSTSTKYNPDYMRDFSYFIDKVKNVLDINNRPENLQQDFFLYNFRFGLNVYYQYVLKIDNIKEKRKLLNQIYIICSNSINIKNIRIDNNLLNKYYIIYLKAINYLLSKHKLKLAVSFIELANFAKK